MKNYKMVMSYDGTKYGGWQKQTNISNTIQEVLETALKDFTKEDVQVISSGRTDKGVHANNQVVNFKLNKSFNKEEIRTFLNNTLDHDICIKSINIVDERFHSRYNAVSKTYVYKILNSKNHNPFKRKYFLHYPEKLDIELMREGAEYFIGEHDFVGMSSLKKHKKSTVREIFDIKILNDHDEIEIHIKGDGFLYNMVRIMVGTLIEVGAGRLKPSDIEKILLNKERSNAGKTVPPLGLYLNEIVYGTRKGQGTSGTEAEVEIEN